MDQILVPAREVSISKDKFKQALMLSAAALIALFALYLVGIDNGHLLAIFEGKFAFGQNLIHEGVHDSRHVAGFPCH